MVPRRYATCLIACSLLLLPIFAQAGTVTLDFAGQTAVSDAATLSPYKPEFKGEQVALWVRSTRTDPQPLTLKVTGLKDGGYDVYANGSYMYAKSTADLEKGLEFTIEGQMTHPDVMRCLEKVLPKIEAEYGRIEKSSDPEEMRVAGTLRQALVWVKSGLKGDESARSVDVIITPAGKVLQKPTERHRFTAKEVAESNSRRAWLLQNARDRMYDVIKNAELRNREVAALTPIDIYTGELKHRDGKLLVKVGVINSCNLAVSCDFSIAVPKGWKFGSKAPSEPKHLGPGRFLEKSMVLVPAAKDAAVPASVAVAANLTIAQDAYAAKLKLKATATQR